MSEELENDIWKLVIAICLDVFLLFFYRWLKKNKKTEEEKSILYDNQKFGAIIGIVLFSLSIIFQVIGIFNKLF